MNNIRILPEILANKIAAGEVVERPASVVKELVENALDAQSSRIIIEIENGGRSLIRVADNGTGMGHDDALLSLERFATSKIRNDPDLFAIQTLGFRGEALPSIASVSKMTLITRDRASDSGVQIKIHGGKIIAVDHTGAPQGTMIIAEQLFFNTPARRKFLKTVNTEMGHIADIVAGMALGYPQVHFKLNHNGKQVKQWLKTSDPAKRVAGILGQISSNDLIQLKADNDYLKIDGWLTSPRLARSTSRGIYLYVNGRRVRDRVVQHALFDGYSGRLMKGRYPAVVLFLNLPFDQVDVNVHPTKHEIRFAQQRRVHDLVRDHVAAVLNQDDRRMWTVDPSSLSASAIPDDHITEPPVFYTVGKKNQALSTTKANEPFTIKPTGLCPSPDNSFEKLSQHQAADKLAAPAPEQKTLWTTGGFSDLTFIGRFAETYLICQTAKTLILIDQHAAHERVVYEQLLQNREQIESQQLVIPETVELNFAEAQVLQRLLPRFYDLGLGIEHFGDTTFVVKAVPAMLDKQDISKLVLELVEKTAALDIDAELDKILDQCRMVMACHNAVRARQHLTDAEIRHLLRQLDQCQNPSHCPHGRPTWIEWTLKDLEKAFGRIGA